MTILLALIILLDIISYIVIFDVILSWINLLGFRIRPRFIADIIDPMYLKVKKTLPTTFGPFDFTPILIIIIISFIQGFLYIIFPGLQTEVINLIY